MSRCVLVAEDEALVNNFTSSELRAAGCEVLTAYDTDEAIRILEKRSDIDLVFTDINMPGSMDGLKLITTGKSAPTTAQMPAGSTFIPKPYEIPDVLKAIHAQFE
jgi:CheY-like chemotaxis protein